MARKRSTNVDQVAKTEKSSPAKLASTPRKRSKATTSASTPAESGAVEPSVKSKSKSAPKTKSESRPSKGKAPVESADIPPCLRGFGPPALQPAKPKRSAAAKPFFIPIREEFQWKKKLVTVSFFAPDASGIPGIADQVMKIAEKWTDDVLLKLTRTKDNDPSADIRVMFQGPGQFYSLIGTQSRQGTTPSMNLGFRPGDASWDRPEERRRLILHEFGHALGLHHEHKHPSMGLITDRVLEYYSPRLPGYSRDQIAFQFSALSENEIDPKFKEFSKNPDPDSIMMYEFPANLSEKFPQGVKGGNDLSPKDREGIVKLYGEDEKFVPGPQGLELVVDSPVKRAYWLFGKDKGLFHFRIDSPGEYEILVSSETMKDDPKILDPFAGIPLPFQPQMDIFKLGTHFEIYPADSDSPISKGKKAISGLGFTVEVPDEITEGMDDTVFARTLKLDKKGLYFLEVTNATADVAQNDVSRFIVRVRKKTQ